MSSRVSLAKPSGTQQTEAIQGRAATAIDGASGRPGITAEPTNVSRTTRPAFGWSLANIPAISAPAAPRIRPKLRVGAVDDPLEREADRVADHVMRIPDAGRVADAAFSDTSRVVRRKHTGPAPDRVWMKRPNAHICAPLTTAAPAWYGPPPLLRSPAAASVNLRGPSAPPSLTAALRSPGSTLSAPVRGFFESRFGTDLSDVRVHDDSAAHASARDVGALAYTVGSDIVFARGAYDPSSRSGRRLIAHELAHVVQSGGVDLGVVRRAPAGGSIQGELGELLATQFLDEQGFYIFVDWSKHVNENGFDFIAFDPKTKRTWYVDNKAYSATIDEVTSFAPSRFATNEAAAKSFLQKVGTKEATAALEAVEKGAVEKVVINAFSKGNAGFSEKVFAAGIKAFDVRLGKLFSSRTAWLNELKAEGLLTGVRKFARRDRVLGSQRGFATIGGMVFTLIVIGTTVYAISQAEDKPKALLEAATDFAVAGLVYRLAGGSTPIGTIALLALSLCSDDAKMQEECERREVVIKFLRKFMPKAVKTNSYVWGLVTTDDVDPQIYQEAYDFLFNTQPIVLQPSPKAKAPFVAAPAGPYSPPSGPPPSK